MTDTGPGNNAPGPSRARIMCTSQSTKTCASVWENSERRQRSCLHRVTVKKDSTHLDSSYFHYSGGVGKNVPAPHPAGQRTCTIVFPQVQSSTQVPKPQEGTTGKALQLCEMIQDGPKRSLVRLVVFKPPSIGRRSMIGHCIWKRR